MTGRAPASKECQVSGYVTIIERVDDGGYGVWAPDLPGCVAAAEARGR